jgi:hypothetical protein
MKYEPPKVSRHFKYDWQFAADMSRLPLLRPASIAIGFMPLILQVARPLFGVQLVTVPTSIWITWLSAVAFILSWTILRFRCPSLILDYRHYGEFKAHEHSHRWIVWLFYKTISELSSWQTIVQETLAKGLSVNIEKVAPQCTFSVCPYLVKKGKNSKAEPFAPPTDNDTVTIHDPVNINRDLYVPIHCYGERILLLLQEDDPKREEKEKELFWILYSQAAKERPRWRAAFWVLLYTSFGLLALNVLKNVFLVVWWMFFGSGAISASDQVKTAVLDFERAQSAQSGGATLHFQLPKWKLLDSFKVENISVSINGQKYVPQVIANSISASQKGSAERAEKQLVFGEDSDDKAPSRDLGSPSEISIEIKFEGHYAGRKDQ